MPRPRSEHPTDRELEILTLLWEAGPLELGGICSAIRRRRGVATTTVATMLQVMLDKGLVRRRQGPKGYVWSARLTQEAATRGILGKVVERVFEGSTARLVAHLLEDGRLSATERAEIHALLDADRRRSGGRSR